MDITDIIDMQSDAAMESTLESEIDALSKIITDTKDSGKKLVDTDDDFKLDSDDLVFTTSLQCESVEKDKCEQLCNDSLKSIFSDTEDIQNVISKSSIKGNFQQTSNETLKLINDSQEEKYKNNKLQDQTQNSTTFTILSENIKQIDKNASTLHTEICKVNNSLLLISEAYSSQQSQSYLQNQSTSIPRSKELVESTNITNIQLIDNLNSDIQVRIHDNMIKGSLSDLSSDASINVDQLRKKLNINTAEKFMIQNLAKQNTKNKSDDKPDLVQKINLLRKDNFTAEYVHLKDTEEKNNLNTYQTDKNAGKMILEVDNLNKTEEKNAKQLIPNILQINITEGTNNCIKQFINEENKNRLTNINDEIQQQNKCKHSIIENRFINIEGTIDKIEIESAESSTPITELKDTLEMNKKQLENIVQNFEQNIEDFNLSENRVNLKPAINNSLIKQKNIKLENNLLTAGNNQQAVLQLEKLNEIDKQESLNVESTETDNETIKNINVFEKIRISKDLETKIKNKKITSKSVVDKVEKNIEHLKNLHVNASMETSHEMEKDITDFIQKIEMVNVIKPSQNIKTLKNSEIDTNPKLLEEPMVINNKELLEEIENIKVTKNININTQFFKNIDASSNIIEDLQHLESVKVLTESENGEFVKKNLESKAVISTAEFDNVDEKKNLSEELFSSENNKIIDKYFYKNNEEEKLMEKDSNLFANMESHNSNISNINTNQIAFKGLLKLENIYDQAADILQNNKLQVQNESVIQQSSTRINEKSTEKLILTRVKKSEDFNIKLKLKLQVEEESSIKMNTQEKLIQKKNKILNKQVKDQLENLSFEYDKYNLTNEYLSVEQTELNNSLNDLSINKNSNIVQVPENEEPDLNIILDINKKVEEIISGDQALNSQEISSKILNEIEKDLCSDLNKLLEIEKNVNKEVIDFINLENSNLSISNIQLLDKKSQDSLLIDDRQTKLILNKNKEKQIKELKSTEKDQNMVNKKFICNLDNSCIPNDLIKNSNTVLENDKSLNESIYKNEQNKKNEEKEKKPNKNTNNSNISEDTENNLQLETLGNKSSTFFKNQRVVDKSSEISELESAVKYLQKSEEREIDRTRVVKNTISEENASIFVSVEDNVCDNVPELVSDLQEMTDPIAISEAEIISEATKLETEYKEKLKQEDISSAQAFCNTENMNVIKINDISKLDNLMTEIESNKELNILPEIIHKEALKVSMIMKNNLTSESLPTISILEYGKDSPSYEIPEILSKIEDPKTSLLMQNDIKLRVESPDRFTKNTEPKTNDTSKKDFDKQQQQYSDCENIGSPRIILKIAKSAITECSEPRSPKSPKIRSTAHSPNPEDSLGQKLGKIKLKLSKSGHPSIIPNNDNYDETTQWHTDSTSSLSPLGMKIKLTKSADALILDNKYEEVQKHEEFKEKMSHKIEEIRKSETSIGMKIKLSKSRDASIIQQDCNSKDINIQEVSILKKPESPLIGMKIKLSKFGDASIIHQDNKIQFTDETVLKFKDKVIDEMQDSVKRTELPIGMKIKLSKSGDASVVANESSESVKDVLELKNKNERIDSTMGVKIKLAKMKDGGASIINNESIEEVKEKHEIIEISKKNKLAKKKDSETIDTKQKGESDIFNQQDQNKLKISKIIINEIDKGLSTDSREEISKSSIGMKIKLSKTGDASIIHSETSKEAEDLSRCSISKHSKNKDYGSIVQSKCKDDSHLEMKIKLLKATHLTKITNEVKEDSFEITNISLTQSHKDHTNLPAFNESSINAIKNNNSDGLIETTKSQSLQNTMIDLHHKRKEITIAPIESKKLKIETNLKQILPDVTIQPIVPKITKEQPQQKLLLESNSRLISRQQMNVINQEISITQVCSLATGDTLMGEKLKNALNMPNESSISSPLNSDCEIIEPQPELIIVNENSNSSQDIMIIDEVPSKSMVKMPKKRGRPRRNTTIVSAGVANISSFQEMELQKDPLSLEQMPITLPIPLSMPLPVSISMPIPVLQHQMQPQIGTVSTEGTERPRRTCRSQKSYAPPKRGRGRGRGKRKNETVDIPLKKQRIEQDLTAIENATTTTITLQKFSIETSSNINNSPELFKALNQPILECVTKQMKDVDKLEVSEGIHMPSTHEKSHNEEREILKDIVKIVTVSTIHDIEKDPSMISSIANKDDMNESADNIEVTGIKETEEDEKQSEPITEHTEIIDHKGCMNIQEHQNWLAPSIKKIPNESSVRNESISTLAVIDEETRMSGESGSRSQTPARNMVVPGTSETLVNEESQGSVLSTATTESEKVKVKNRRMEISFDPDEGPFTVEKIAEYEWPLERKDDRLTARGETFMIQEQISQYLGVKSFKRKYPDLKRRMVDMEERNFLRENGLVSESMCDMGLTAVNSSEVLDIMCSDFPEQYEEYRKHMREKVAKEHSKKQKELSAAANAERNRIDLAEMAMQSALSWNSCLNKARLDSRKCSLDLQTFTIHMPKRPIKLDLVKRVNHYPVALIPGQYVDYYREYTPAELRYYPLNTVLYGPMRPNERKFDSQSEGSQSDSDSDSSSDDSSSSSSGGTQNTDGSQSTVDEVDMELALHPNIKCKICLNNLNKNHQSEVLIQCGTCTGNVHPSCIDLTLDMVPHIRAYAWQCTDCKTCAQCHDPADEDKMLFCDMCDRGYHIYCVGLRRVPQGRWHCQECAICANCGSKEPSGVNLDRNSVAQWQHEYKKGDKNTKVYVSTFCVPCSKLWRKGRYCPHCSRCHNASRLDLEVNLVHCGVCDKYLHLDCVETKGQIIDKKHYFCEFCSSNRQQLAKPLISKIFKINRF